MLLRLVVDVEVTVCFTGGYTLVFPGNGWAAGLGLEAPDDF